MRVAVLAECERLCPDTYKPYIDDDGCVSIWRKLRWNLEPYFEATAGNETTVLGVDATNWAMFYRLLGLSERDAVEEKDVKIGELRTSFEGLFGKFEELEKRNAALVAALQTLKKAVGYKPKRRDEIISYRNDIGIFIDDVLAANEKGGAND